MKKSEMYLTQDLIDDALLIFEEPMRSTLGMKCDWQTFAKDGPIEVQMSIWGNWRKPERTLATFWKGSKRISRLDAELLLNNIGHLCFIGKKPCLMRAKSSDNACNHYPSPEFRRDDEFNGGSQDEHNTREN